MDYGRTKPLVGENVSEKTVLTMKSITELLAEEGTDLDELERSGQAPQATLQHPPDLKSTTAQSTGRKADALPRLSAIEGREQPEKRAGKARSILFKLFGV